MTIRRTNSVYTLTMVKVYFIGLRSRPIKGKFLFAVSTSQYLDFLALREARPLNYHAVTLRWLV